jgi:hypothetical protein
VETSDGHKFALSQKPQIFTVNFPSTFDVPPGEYMVYRIRLDDQWIAVPPLPMADATPMAITLRAIYKVKATPEAAKGKVWIGRLLSSDYHFYLRHW